MARIHEMLRQLRLTNAALADDIEREMDVLGARRAFGLNFERHTPEAVELPGRPVRTGDKVHVLPARHEKPKAANSKLWRVVAIDGKGDDRVANLEAHPRIEPTETAAIAVADLVAVAEFRDPIYPGLVSTGRVENGGDKPFHTVINGENFHALQTLLFTHRGKIDAIYIDPPYNTGARDWKYNNDYVESDDLYRHSKWLVFMERRLLLAKELLNPDDSVLVVTIDEREGHRLGLLLGQVFPEARVQMVSSVINPKGVPAAKDFSRVDEWLFFVMIGSAAPARWITDMTTDAAATVNATVRWVNLKREGTNWRRADRPGMFYPIFADPVTGRIVDFGTPIAATASRNEVADRDGLLTVWPIKPNGEEARWQQKPDSARGVLARGYMRSRLGRGENTVVIEYLSSGQQTFVADGRFVVTGHDAHGAVIVEGTGGGTQIPKTIWKQVSHSATDHGSKVLSSLLPGRTFPFPKSLYAVEDTLRFFVAQKPDATIVDFFSGSGTTAHAVMRLNKQDDGRRVSISVTNNEVSTVEQAELRAKGLRMGDPDWEAFGICEYVTKPRILAAITGRTPEGEPINGDYKFTDEFPMSDGFEENVEFLTLTYEAPLRLRANRGFRKVAPLLWLRAGSRGRRIEDMPKGWDVADAYGVIADLDKTDDFFRAFVATPAATIAFVITDDDALFEAIAVGLPDGVEPVRLYDAYLRNFEIDAMQGAR